MESSLRNASATCVLTLQFLLASTVASAQEAPSTPSAPSTPLAPAAPAPVLPAAPVGSPPAAAAVPVATPASNLEPTEANAWLRELYAKSRNSVVFIETDRGIGSGFLFHSPDLVATALHVVGDARQIKVRTTSGKQVEATITAYDTETDTALLQLPEPLTDGTPLLPALGDLPVGTPVAVIGHPFSPYQDQDKRLKGLLDWSLSQGVVGATSDQWIQTDAAVNPGNSGGPLLNAKGEVVGIISSRLQESQGIGFAARISFAEKLMAKRGMPARFVPVVESDKVELAYLMQLDDDLVSGFSLGAGACIEHHLSFRGRLGYASSVVQPKVENVVSRQITRTSFDLEAFWSPQPNTVAARASVGAGLSLLADSERRTAATIAPTTGCTPSATEPCLSIHAEEQWDSHWRFLPYLGATVDFGPLRAGYAYQFAIKESQGESIQRLYVGLAL